MRVSHRNNVAKLVAGVFRFEANMFGINDAFILFRDDINSSKSWLLLSSG